MATIVYKWRKLCVMLRAMRDLFRHAKACSCSTRSTYSSSYCMCETDAALMRAATACHPVLSVLVQAGDLRQVSVLLAKTLLCVQILVSSGNALFLFKPFGIATGQLLGRASPREAAHLSG